MTDVNYRQLSLTCKQCGNTFVSNRKKKYCNIKCSWTAKDRRNGVPAKIYKPKPICLMCGIEFQGHPSSQQIKDGGAKYCSRTCYNNHRFGDKSLRDAIKADSAAKTKYGMKIRRLISCLRILLAKKIYQEKSQALKNLLTSSPCKQCGKPVGYGLTGRPKKYCSRQCIKNSPEHKLRIALNRQRRDERLKNNFVELVNPYYVLKRDGYKCQICRVKTPLSLRGSYHDNAPEVDHIIPLAKGGEHSYLNTQCLCRKCNINKSDKEIGQLRLVA